MPGALPFRVGPPTTGLLSAMLSAVSRTMPSRSRWDSRFVPLSDQPFAS